ncbi:hypothetical protein GN244_ATG01993 [Phytophthora infestans]|uniref:Secreted RxLR effector peptide protein n=1 Tax=Phytophthora infestans TaxID=4787 RepID=A0A833WPL6_PHYIN|nr:hypothetical protein GN244_ATG01993 [Phytophthora infestans]KAF4144387.1 hypothetical protein GN958_ATG06397 [Phytophthora infestans]
MNMQSSVSAGVLVCLALWITTVTSSCVHDQLAARLVSSTQSYDSDPRRPHDVQYGQPAAPSSDNQEQPIIIEQAVELQELRWPV